MPQPTRTLGQMVNTRPVSRRNMTPEEWAALQAQGSQGMERRVGPLSLAGLVDEALGAANIPADPLDWALEGAGELFTKSGAEKYLPFLPFLPLIGTVRNPAGRTVPGTTKKSGAKTVYIPAPESVQREAQKLMTLRDLTEKQATRAAAGKVKWQEWDRPEIEAQYGELRPSTFGATKKRTHQNTPAAVDRKAEEMRDFLRQPTEPWTPRDYGAFDRSLIRDAMEGFPGVEQTMPVRPTPRSSRSDISHVDEVYLDPRNRELIKGQIARGLPLGGRTFYPSMYPVKHEWLQRGGAPAKFDEWAEQVATASARNSLSAEMSVGNALRQMYYRGIPITPENVRTMMDGFKQKYGQGLPLFEGHARGSARRLEQGITMKQLIDRGLTDSFKIPTYGMQKRGDFKHTWTGDVHEAKGETYGTRFNPYFGKQGGFGEYEYGPAEAHMRNISNEMGLPAVGTAQAGRWFGGGEKTGLVSPRGDALDQIEQQAAYALHEAGRPTDPVSVRNFIMELIEKGGEVPRWTPKDIVMPDYRIVRPSSADISRVQTR